MKHESIKITYTEPQLAGQSVKTPDGVRRFVESDVLRDQKTFAGSVNADGSVNLLPRGWTVTWPTSGDDSKYTVHHDLNTSEYAVTPVVVKNFSGHQVQVFSKTETSFVVVSQDPAGAGVANAFDFILVANQ